LSLEVPQAGVYIPGMKKLVLYIFVAKAKAICEREAAAPH
jgi:hypothetical protein